MERHEIARSRVGSAPKLLEERPHDDFLPLAVSNAEKEQLFEALRRTGGNRTEAATLLRIHRTTLYFRLKKHGIDLVEVGIRRKTNRDNGKRM